MMTPTRSLQLSNEVHIQIEPIHKIYTNDTGRFPTRARSGNQYIMVAYHCDTNTILVQPFATPSDNKFETMDMTRDDETGAPILSDWSALLRCKTTALIPAGDHDIVLAEVLDFAHRPSQPLLFVHGQFASLASEPASVG